MIEAASLGVHAGWQDAGAVRGLKDLQREVANLTAHVEQPDEADGAGRQECPGRHG